MASGPQKSHGRERVDLSLLCVTRGTFIACGIKHRVRRRVAALRQSPRWRYCSRSERHGAAMDPSDRPWVFAYES